MRSASLLRRCFSDLASKVFGGSRRPSEVFGDRRLSERPRGSPARPVWAPVLRRLFRPSSPSPPPPADSVDGVSSKIFRRLSEALGGFRGPMEAFGGPQRLPRGPPEVPGGA